MTQTTAAAAGIAAGNQPLLPLVSFASGPTAQVPPPPPPCPPQYFPACRSVASLASTAVPNTMMYYGPSGAYRHGRFKPTPPKTYPYWNGRDG